MRRLRTWVRKDAGVPASTARCRHGPEGQAEEPTLLRAENAKLLKAEKEWQLERKVLRRAAACSANHLVGELVVRVVPGALDHLEAAEAGRQASTIAEPSACGSAQSGSSVPITTRTGQRTLPSCAPASVGALRTHALQGLHSARLTQQGVDAAESL